MTATKTRSKRRPVRRLPETQIRLQMILNELRSLRIEIAALAAANGLVYVPTQYKPLTFDRNVAPMIEIKT